MGNEVIKVIDTLAEKFGVVIDWTQQNVQPYIQDLMHRVVQYELVTSIVLTIIWLCIIILCIIAFWRGFKGLTKPNSDDMFYIWTSIMFIAFLFFVVGFCFCSDEIDDIIQCIFLPEKVFIEEIQSIIR